MPKNAAESMPSLCVSLHFKLKQKSKSAVAVTIVTLKMK